MSDLLRTFTVAVSNGDITGTSDTGEAITGRVQGTTLTMSMVLGDTLNRLAGEISYGAASGTYNQFLISDGAMKNGLFLATFTPSTITAQQTTNLFNALANISSGVHYVSTRDFLIGDVAPFTSYGQLTVSNMSQSGFDYSGFTNTTIADNNSPLETWSDTNGTASFFEGSRIFAFAQPYNTVGDDEIIYIIGAPGNRKCIGVTYFVEDDAVRSVVEITLVRNTQVAPLIQPETTYNATVAVSHMGLLTNQRTYNLEIAAFSGGQVQTPTFAGGLNAGYMFVGGENIIMAGSTLMMKRCADFSNPIAPGDYIMGLEMYEGGAMSGTRIDGGTLEGIPISEYPSAVAIFMRKDGQAAPDFKGTLNFLSRTMYSLDYTLYAEDYAYGAINLDTVAGTAVLTAHNGIGAAISANLTAEKVMDSGTFTGMVHIYGDLGGTNGYVDIFWPVGSKRATYFTSEAVDGTTFSVGEAYLTF